MRLGKLQKREAYYRIDLSEMFHYRKSAMMTLTGSFDLLPGREFGATTLFLQRENLAFDLSWIAWILMSGRIARHEESLFWNWDGRNSGHSFPRSVSPVVLCFHIEALEICLDHED